MAGPTIRDKRCVPPAPGIIANFVSTNPVSNENRKKNRIFFSKTQFSKTHQSSHHLTQYEYHKLMPFLSLHLTRAHQARLLQVPVIAQYYKDI